MNFILTSKYTLHVGSRWYTSVVHEVTIDINAFFWHQGLCPCSAYGGDSLLHTICCTSQVLLVFQVM